MRRLQQISITFWIYFLTGIFSASFGQTEIKVGGLGFFGNLDMKRRVVFLSGAEENEEEFLSPRDVEDLSYIILQQLLRDGYGRPEVTASMEFMNGEKVSYTWTPQFQSQYSEEMATVHIKTLRFDCNAGILNHYKSVEVQGIEAIDEETVNSFFLPSGVLFTRKKDLAFTKANLQSRLTRILNSLNSLGYLQARVTERDIQIDPKTGKVAVSLRFDQGPLHHVGTVRTEIEGLDKHIDISTTDQREGVLFNNNWMRVHRQELLNVNYREGYPDTQIQAKRTIVPGEDPETARVDVVFEVTRGPKVNLTGIQFQPEGLLRKSLLLRTVELDLNKPFDLLQVEKGRRSLLSLGVLNDVDLQKKPDGAEGRIALYSLTPLPQKNLHLLAGWGSYEQARVGLKWEQLNLWNLAHRYEFAAVQSFKSSNVDVTYFIPHFFEKEITAYVRTGYEFREEISYDRSTSTFLMGAGRRLEKPGIELSVEYSLEEQKAEQHGPSRLSSRDVATVSSLFIRGVMDRRDSPLYPTSGYDVSLSSKTAARILGGNSEFQKIQLTTSYHKYLGNALYLHASLRYGGIFSKTPTSENLPFNERFFQGGENSIRGYTRGEASPVSSEGQLTGAETYGLVNLELEQRLFNSLALVAFWDGLGQKELLNANTGIEYLQSAGLGLRLRTPIGPIRLEYGHNLNPRPTDPNGTLHFSVGFPF